MQHDWIVSSRVKFDDCTCVASSREQSKLSSNGIRLLYPGSTGTFLKRQGRKKLGIEGVTIHLQHNTIHGTKVITSQKVTGLEAEDLERTTKVELLNV